MNHRALLPGWQATALSPPIARGQLHLWLLISDSTVKDAFSLLSDHELQRAEKIIDQAQRADFLRTRSIQRRILAGYLEMSPAEIPFGTGPKGKPFLDLPDCDLRFNLSHSGELRILAVTRGGDIGLDVERIRQRPTMENVARRLFGRVWEDGSRGLSAKERTGHFFHLWTRMEAGVKALGGSLFDATARAPDNLSYRHFTPATGYLGCVAMSAPCPPPEEWLALRLDDEL